uniref:Disease resistance R13L4/SHOC-2-like LRR domain-containing protein n=1 Tax=Brassica oleracea TaxID=3712 RepID=A0A3P6EP20_BRAOL|nr:unnamed protein product [Brassica oleracea]
MTLRLHVDSISFLSGCFFALSFLVTTLVSQPFRHPDQVETLLAFKNEFSICNNSKTSYWSQDAASFDGVVFDGDTGAVAELHLGGACISGNLKANSSLYRFQHLRYLDLSSNDFSSSFPAEFGRLTSLEVLDLHHNGFTGEVPSSICNLSRLTSLDLSVNKLTGGFPLLHNLTKLSSISLSYNNFSGTTLQNLQHLDISNNRLKGKVPAWLWNLPSLTSVRLTHNSFDGFEGSPDVLLSLSLLELDLSSNAFHGAFPVIPRSMEFISASNNHFSGGIPRTLCDSIFLNVLDLSNNSFSHPIPECLSESLQVLNLSHNKLVGELPDIFYGSGSLTTVDVGHNKISGELPRSLRQCTGLEILNVENNLFADTFPFWLNVLPVLKVIVLRSNGFYGPISFPDQDNPSFSQLRIIDISHNDFNGSLPPNYFVNWSAPLISMPEGDSFPKYMVHSGNTFLLDVGWTSYFSMHLRHKGLNREFEKIIETYTFIDFSGNRLGGHIPESIGLLKSLIVLDLSNNNFTGHIPSSLANLTQLESLDLSRNQLSGRIPQELTVLTFLAYINMSHNKLTGQIPQITQIIGQNGSSFEGNIDLCGLPLNKTCFMEHEAPSPKLPKKEHMLNWKAVAIGYGPGVLFGIAMGHVFYSYKPVLFFKLFRL